ncbi:uracil-DNA glycosylase [Candidatus Pacearchaeota archaeon]|nr:MAG: uracil-DNA glycosylase [Candidatus Pacearchaeota archaeon]
MICKWYDICPLRQFEKQEKISEGFKEEYCKTEENWKNCKRFQMEEKGLYHPDNLMPNGEILE